MDIGVFPAEPLRRRSAPPRSLVEFVGRILSNVLADPFLDFAEGQATVRSLTTA